MDSFCEYLIKRKKKSSEKVICIFLIIAVLVFSVVAPLYLFPLVYSLYRDATTLIFPLIVAAWWGVLILIKRYNVEFEYCLTGNDIDIDKIINKKKRTKVMSASLRTMAIVAPVDSKYYTDTYKNMITVDCSARDNQMRTFFAVYRVDGQQKCLLFNPSEKMLSHMQLYCRDNFYLS